MGKTTDTYMSAIDKLNDSCLAAFKVLLGNADALQNVVSAMARNFDAQNDRIQAVIGVDPKKVNRLTPEQEQAANDDAQSARLGREAVLLFAQKVDLQKAKTAADDECCDAVNDLSSKVEEFRAYVKKKEASKNPFKSKKSLPAAREFLKKADDTVDEVIKVTKSLR